MPLTDEHRPLFLDNSSEAKLTTFARELLEGNYTNFRFLIDLFDSSLFKQDIETNATLQKSIRDISAECKQKSEEGCSHAMVLQGLLYFKGIGCQISYAQAIHFFDKAIQLDNSYAMSERAYMHQNGFGEPLNYSETIRLYEKAIELKNAHAMFGRAFMHHFGLGGPANVAEAIRLYEQAMELGYAHAFTNRAYMHQHGDGGPRDFNQAIKLYKKAMKLGSSTAFVNRAYMHAEGQGGNVNVPEAIRLYEQAIELGNPTAMCNRARLHKNGVGGPVNVAQAIRLYESAIRCNFSRADELVKDISLDSNTAKQLVDLIWDDLLAGKSFSNHTLSALIRFCKKDIITRLKTSALGTSLTFLNQLKNNSKHPLTLIINGGDQKNRGSKSLIARACSFFRARKASCSPKESEEFKWLMTDACSLYRTRVTFFCEGSKQGNHSAFNRLPPEMKRYLFSFVQPGFEYDKEKNYFLPSFTQNRNVP